MRARLALAAAPALLLAACGDGPTIDPRKQIGANPELPEPREYLFPPMGIAKTAPWAGNEAPRPAAGLRVTAWEEPVLPEAPDQPAVLVVRAEK